MKRNIFAVCDLEVDYALNFMDYMNRKKNIPFEIQAFTSVENLIAYGKQTHIELLLISGRAMCREVRDLDIGKIIILSEGVHPPELDQYPSVYKYQSSSDVLREVMACYGAEKKTVADQIAVLKKTTEIIGIFSPLGRCLKTSFALTLGQILAKERAVLYLNMEEYSGFEELMGKGFAHNLSDLLYYVRQDNQTGCKKCCNKWYQVSEFLTHISDYKAVGLLYNKLCHSLTFGNVLFFQIMCQPDTQTCYEYHNNPAYHHCLTDP